MDLILFRSLVIEREREEEEGVCDDGEEMKKMRDSLQLLFYEQDDF